MFLVLAAQMKSWESSGCMTNEGVPTLKCLEVVFGNILFMSTALIILTLFLMLTIGAFNYLTSFGNAEKVKKAQGTIKMAIFGFILFLGSYLILKIIDLVFLGGKENLFNFELP